MTEFRTFQQRGADAYDNGDHITVNPFLKGTIAYTQFEVGYWNAYDAHCEAQIAATEKRYGIEEGYGNWYDTDAVSQGMYDDDPSPYDGTYSEM